MTSVASFALWFWSGRAGGQRACGDSVVIPPAPSYGVARVGCVPLPKALLLVGGPVHTSLGSFSPFTSQAMGGHASPSL